jgi:hypothetical protein
MKTGTPDVKEIPHFLRCSLLAALMIDNNHCALPGGGPVEPYTGSSPLKAWFCLGVYMSASVFVVL